MFRSNILGTALRITNSATWAIVDAIIIKPLI